MPDDTVEFAPQAQAEEAGKTIQQASERIANFWMGALSPMWVPFFAATSFGISAWSVTQALSAARGGRRGHRPLGFVNPWLADTSVMSTVLAETESAIRGTQRAAVKMMMEAEEVAAEAAHRLPQMDVRPSFVPESILPETVLPETVLPENIVPQNPVEAVAEALQPAPPSAVAAAMDSAADSLEPLGKPAPKKKRIPKAEDDL